MLANGKFHNCSSDADWEWKITDLQTVGRGLAKIQ